MIGTGRELTNQFFEGVIDELRIYERALNVAEIDTLYNLKTPIVTTVEEPQETFVTIFPNPAKMAVSISCDCDVSSVMIFGMSGQLIETIEGKSSFDVSHMTRGIYFFIIQDDKGAITRKKVLITD